MISWDLGLVLKPSLERMDVGGRGLEVIFARHTSGLGGSVQGLRPSTFGSSAQMLVVPMASPDAEEESTSEFGYQSLFATRMHRVQHVIQETRYITKIMPVYFLYSMM